MEIQPPPIKMTPSPTVSSSAIVSPESLSHQSSPAKTSRIYFQTTSMPTAHHLAQHDIIDETVNVRLPLSISSHQQMATTLGTPVDHPHSSISALSGMHSDVSSTFKEEKKTFVLKSKEKETIRGLFGLSVVWSTSESTANMPELGHNTNITDNRRPSFSITVSFVIASSSSSCTSAITIHTTTFTTADSLLYTATRN